MKYKEIFEPGDNFVKEILFPYHSKRNDNIFEMFFGDPELYKDKINGTDKEDPFIYLNHIVYRITIQPLQDKVNVFIKDIFKDGKTIVLNKPCHLTISDEIMNYILTTI